MGLLRVRGVRREDVPALEITAGVEATPLGRIRPGRARDGVTGELEVDAEAVARVELENGFVLWLRADDLAREYGQRTVSREGREVWEFGSLLPESARSAARAERGLLGLGIRVLDFFGIDLKAKTAAKLAETLEKKNLDGRQPGLYRCSLDDAFALTPVKKGEARSAAGDQALVFIHGTASSCAGSFGRLWDPGNDEGKLARERLKARYGDRVFAFEHRTLTESPVANALALAEALGALLGREAELNLVTHSRGGLVGELLCLGSCERAAEVLDRETLSALFAADRTIALQLGLSPLHGDIAEARDKAYDADRERLQKLLKARMIPVTRFVRVACPARGTTLASGRLDRWLSVLDFLSGRFPDGGAAGGIFADGIDFLLAVVKERTDPRTLPGLEAMMPGSALTRLLHHPELLTSADLSVISGDVEGDSLWQRIKIVATDWFYGADHDLVVNTGSMSGGLARPDGRARFRKDQGADVNHFRYFANARSVRWLVAGLTRGEGEDGGFLPIEAAQKEAPRWREAVARSRAAATPRPLAVVLPGTMGSHLLRDGAHIWLNYGALLGGGLRKLAIDAEGVLPGTLVDAFYGPLLEFLARSHHVEFFAYDWRLSVRDAAEKLAERLDEWLSAAERHGQPVHIVAHSMGGLVVRAMIADGGRGAALWERITRLPNSRFLMLGTPNHGSHEALRWLTGFNPTQAKLALLDLTQTAHGIIRLVRKYPGLLELLPFAPEGQDFGDPSLWKTIRDRTRAGWAPPEAAALDEARGTWAFLRRAAPDPRFMCYAAGVQWATVVDYELADDDAPWNIGFKRLDFIATREGDGTVTWASGRLPGVPTWYVDGTAHDALCAERRAFPGYLDLLMTGTTSRLLSAPPARWRAGDDTPARFVLPHLPPADSIPAESELREFSFGGGLPQPVDGRPAAPTIEVSIRHGDLAYARHPVLVGHYHGDTIVSAEAALDRHLDGALSRRLDLGLYPGLLGTHAVFLNRDPARRPGGAIVVGLGLVGELTPRLLESGVRAALLDYALQLAQRSDEAADRTDGSRRASVSCLLVGSGAGGIPVSESVEAILRGAIAANARLVDVAMEGEVTVDRVQFLELFEDVAIAAAQGLRRVLADDVLAMSLRWPAEQVEAGKAGRRRVRFEEAVEWWHRLEITEEPDRPAVLRFVATTDRARAEETLATGQLALADVFIQRASSSARADVEAARTLHEMLLPLRLRELAPRQRDVVLLVDERSARYPWELLEDRWNTSGRPPAVCAGLVRQLKTAEFRARPAYPFEHRALVVGNPDLGGWERFDDLPGARHEAQRVARALGDGGYLVQDCIDEKAETILENLHREAWRILHFAGHGEHGFLLSGSPDSGELEGVVAHGLRGVLPRRVSGMVIGPGAFLTPGDIEQMRWVPELVFINCCHLGRTVGPRPIDRGALAANLGVQFIRMGVRAVVAAGWAVDDAAAAAYAETFYRHMLDGVHFGEAVRIAREDVFMRFPGVNTWGAYQCYGDPSYRLYRNGRTPARNPSPYYAPSELVTELQNLTEAAKVGGGDGEPAARMASDIAAALDRVPPPQRHRWLARADVSAALGLAWGQVGVWPKAVEWLDKAVEAGEGSCPMQVVEQAAQFRIRQAAEEWLALRDAGLADAEGMRKTFVETIEQAIAELEVLTRRAATAERLGLLGGAFKRLALVEKDAGRRKKALLAMADHYCRAHEAAGGDAPQAFASWALARLVALRLDPAEDGDWRRELEAQAVRIAENLQRRGERESGFSAHIDLAALDLVRLVARCAESPEALRLPEDCPALTERIVASYWTAVRRGARPLQTASLREHLDFLLEQGGPAAAVTEGLRWLRNAVR